MKFSSQKGAISLIALILVIVLIATLVVLGLFFLTPREVGQTTTENANTSSREVPPSDDSEVTSEFTYSFLKLESEKARGQNIIYSPLSIKYALKMLSDGANGNTKKEIDSLIENEGVTKYKNIDKILSLANAVYIKDECSDRVLESYVDNCKEKYDAEVKFDSFEDATNINKWVSEKTFDTIDDLLQDDQVQDPNLVMILVNALGVNMKWKTAFDEHASVKGQFNNKDGEYVEAAYMHKNKVESDDVAYKLDDDVTVLAMDLEENKGIGLEFDAIMPNDIELDEFISGIDKEKIENLLSNLTVASETDAGVNVTFPRLNFDYSIALKKELMDLGIKEAFGMDADFSNITGDKSIFVGDAIHKADILLSEKGVKAAAATAIMMQNKSIAMDEDLPVNVVIDKPFLFVIRDKETGEVWFTGSVYEPVHWDDLKQYYKLVNGEPEF